MSWSGDDVVYSHLFIAAPELLWDDLFLEYLKNKGLLDEEVQAFVSDLKADTKRLNRLMDKAKGKPLFTRILAVAPEIINRKMVELLARSGHITTNEKNTLFILLRTLGVAKGGMPTSRSDILRRARKLLGRGFVEDGISLLLSMKAINRKEASLARAVLSSGTLTIETLQKIRRAKSITEMLALAGSGLIDRRAVEALKTAGLIDSKTAGALINALSYGKAQWTVWDGAKRAEGLAARMAYVVSGSFSFEALEFLKSIKKLTPEQALYLEVAVQMSQRFNRKLMEQMTERRFRVVPGESPIASFARSSQDLDSDLIKLLAEAADESRKASQRLAGSARGAEYAMNAAQLHRAMRRVWEGTGYLTIFHEREVGEAAISASEHLMKNYYQAMTPFARDMMERQARAGLDSYISRKENTLQLSRRVYGNLNLWTGKVDGVINKGLLKGLSAKEMANEVQSLISPRTPGGVRYAAFRLGRTELANSFHNTTIRHTREMPWVRGYKWNRSRSHAHSDVCDEYASEDHDNLGEGVYKKANVPQKPHPQCLCYLTIVGMTDDEFVKGYKAGRFNAYMSTRVREEDLKDRLIEQILDSAGKAVGRVAGQAAMSQGMYALDRMLQSKPRTGGAVNPTRIVAAPGKPPRLWASTIDVEAAVMSPEETAKYEKAQARGLKAREKSVAALKARQNQFWDLRIKSELGGEEFQKKSYEEILPFTSGVPRNDLEIASNGMYGSRAYRVLNRNLRVAKGKLGMYDQQFGEIEDYFPELRQHGADAVEGFLSFQEYNDLVRDMHIKGDEIDPDMHHYLESFENLFGEFSHSENVPEGLNKHSDLIRLLDAQMEPIKGDRMTYRITGNDWFQLNRPLEKRDIGLIFKDHAYTSTEGVKRYFANEAAKEMELDVSYRPNRVRIFLPDGSLAMRMNDVEYEILLSRGSKFQIMGIEDHEGSGAFQKTVDVMLIGQKKVKAKNSSFFNPLSDEEASMWDTLMGEF